jgi:aryl-alcohol dehydrogenase-like predicted oxidoreductase
MSSLFPVEIGRSLGHGVAVSQIILGCNAFGVRFDERQATDLVHAALDLGITTFDTADYYGKGASEEWLGRALGSRRKGAVITSKFGMLQHGHDQPAGKGRAAYVKASIEGSLKRLGTDYVDIYQYHRLDPTTPVEETLGALDDLVREGKVRVTGFCNFPAWRYVDAQWLARVGGKRHFSVAQYEYSLISRVVEAEILPALAHCGSRLLAYFPLATGLLTGKYNGGTIPPGSRFSHEQRHVDRFHTERSIAVARRLEGLAKDWGIALEHVALAWLAAQPAVAGIVSGVSSVGQLRSNLQALEVSLDPEQLAAIDAATRDVPL